MSLGHTLIIYFKNFFMKKMKKVVMGPEGPRGFGPFHPKPKVHAEEEEVPGDE